MPRSWPLAALLLLIAPPATADYQDLYRAGLRSFEFGYFREALVFFEAAAGQEPREGAAVREYGMWRAPYLPHFYQGAALERLGAYAAALEALAESESQDAIRRRKHRKHHRRLLELRAEIRRAIERDVGEVHRGAAADYETLEALRNSPLLTQPELVAAVPELAEIEGLLASSSSSLRDASLVAAASDLQRAMSLLDEARESIETIARQVRRREREREEEKRQTEERERRERALADVRRAEELIAGGACQGRANELLEEVERQRGDGVDVAAADDLDLLAARAHLACDRPALAAEYLRRAEAGGRTPADRLGTVARAIAARRPPAAAAYPEPAREVVAGLSDYLLAGAVAGEEACQAREVERLIARARERLGPDAAVTLPASLPLPYAPNLVLARAHGRCAARAEVERDLARARESGRAPAAELAEIEAWLDRNPELEPYTGSYALLVGAYDYDQAEGWPALYKPGEDVREIERALEAHGFQVTTVVNPGSDRLADALADFFAEHGRERGHRLVFYYAGHGHTEETDHGVKLGYIVPVDAGDPRRDRSNLKRLIGMERFREYARGSNADDLLFMFDSCFAGTVFEATRSCVPPDCEPPAAGDLTVRERVSRPVRMFLTAGSENQMVPDESDFRRMVTRALAGEADRDADGFILGSELGSFVQNTTLLERACSGGRTSPLLALLGREPAEPQWGTLREGSFGLGDLLFHTPEEVRPAPPEVTERRGEISTQLAYWQAARHGGLPDDVRRYLERFPGGVFAPLASWLLEGAN